MQNGILRFLATSPPRKLLELSRNLPPRSGFMPLRPSEAQMSENQSKNRRELAERASNEKDTEKLMALVEELIEVLEERREAPMCSRFH